MKLKKHGAFLIQFVMRYVDEEMSRWEFDLDYCGYVIEHYGAFENEHPRLATRFANTIDAAYSHYSWMTDDAFRLAMSDALDDFFGTKQLSDIY